MKSLLLLCAAVAFVLPCQGFRFGSRNVNIDYKKILYAGGGTVQCDVCEMVVSDVQTLLKGRESEIQNLLDSLCSDLPEQYRSNCTSIVNSYLPIIFALIDDMTPEEVCELLTLCSTGSEIPKLTGSMRSQEAVMDYFLRFASRVSRVKALKDRRINYLRSLVDEHYLCDACEDTISYIHEAVACNYTWNMVAEFMTPLCDIIPGSWKYQCYHFFYSLPSDVNDFADKYLDPIQDCEIFGFCREVITEEVEITIEEDAPFETEQEAEEEEEEEVEMIDDVLPPVNTRRESKKRLKDASRKLKKSGMKRNMKRLGQRGMDRMRRLRRAVLVSIGDGIDNNDIPYDISREASNRQNLGEVPAHKKCEVCRYFSSAAEGVLQYNQEDITNGLTVVFEDICNALPQQWQTDCNTEIRDALPEVIYQAAVTMMNPDHLCIEVIGICQ